MPYVAKQWVCRHYKMWEKAWKCGVFNPRSLPGWLSSAGRNGCQANSPSAIGRNCLPRQVSTILRRENGLQPGKLHLVGAVSLKNDGSNGRKESTADNSPRNTLAKNEPLLTVISKFRLNRAVAGEALEDLPEAKSAARAAEATRNQGDPEGSRHTNYVGQAGRGAQRQAERSEARQGVGFVHSSPLQNASLEAGEGANRLTKHAQATRMP